MTTKIKLPPESIKKFMESREALDALMLSPGYKKAKASLTQKTADALNRPDFRLALLSEWHPDRRRAIMDRLGHERKIAEMTPSLDAGDSMTAAEMNRVYRKIIKEMAGK